MSSDRDEDLRCVAADARVQWSNEVRIRLCQRALATGPEWQVLFRRLAADISALGKAIARIGDEPNQVGFDPREPLVWAWCVLAAMPNDQEQRYQRLPERNAGRNGIADRAPMLRNCGYVMEGDPENRDGQVAWLAALARVLDDDLAALDYWPDDVQAWVPGDWAVPGYDCSVVPVRREHRIGEGRPAQRRGLVYHAVIPHRLGDLEVTLRPHPDPSVDSPDDASRKWMFGAAVFPVVTVKSQSTSGNGFRLLDADIGESDKARLTGQLAQAWRSGCDVVVWPELTMPGSRLLALKEILAASALDRRRIPLVVGGSWHVEQGSGTYANRCEIMLGDGETLLTYDKRRQYPWDGSFEDIEFGTSLPIIVMEDRLIAVAICRDFCDDLSRVSYEALPIDFIVVPSMGNVATADAHLRHAVAQRSMQGTVTVVVQQNPSLPGAGSAAVPSGFSFVLKAQPSSEPKEQTAPFRLLS